MVDHRLAGAAALSRTGQTAVFVRRIGLAAPPEGSVLTSDEFGMFRYIEQFQTNRNQVDAVNLR